MSILRQLASLTLVVTLALSLPGAPALGAAPSAAAASPAIGLAQQLGADASGEPCTGVIVRDSRGDPTIPPAVTLSCNGNPVTVGVVRPAALPLASPTTGPTRRQAIEAAAKRTLAAADFARKMDCPPGRWVTLADGSDMLVGLCTLRDGSWPQLSLTYARGRVLYQAAGLPVLLPALARVIAAESGQPFVLPADFQTRQQLGAKFGVALADCTARDFALADAALREARIDSSSNDFASAEAAYRQALEIQLRVFGESAGAGEVLMALALEVSNQQRFDEAASLFRRADPIIERSGGDFQRARLLAYKALDAANRGHYEDALQFARAANTLRRRSIDRTSDFSGDAGGLAAQSVSKGELLHSLMIEAEMLLRLDDLASAEAAAGEALDIVVHTDGLPLWWRPNVLAFLGELNQRQGRLAVAERQEQDALRLRQRIFGETGPTALSYLALGRLYGAQDARAASLAAWHAGFDILDRERELKSGINFDQIEPFFAVAAAPGAAPTPAVDAELFRAIQLTGASVTDQTIERSAQRLGAADPAIAELLRNSEEAQRQLAALRLRYASATDLPAPQRDAKMEAALAAQIVAAEGAVADAERQLQRSFPSFNRLANPGAVTLPAFRAQLGRDEAVVTFLLGSKQSWVVVVRADRIIARPLTVTQDGMASEVATLRRAFVPRSGQLVPFDLELANTLYRELLEPVAGELDGIRHVVFVAHGPLASLPLAVLVAGKPAPGGSYRDADWLLRHFAISQVPTLGSFVALREAASHHRAPPLPFLGFAAPDFTGQPAAVPGNATAPRDALAALAGQCREARPIAPDLLQALAPLPESAGEAGVVGRLLGADAGALHTGADASEAVLRAQPLDQYRVLYFATHGLLPGELHCQGEPALALAPPTVPATTRATDGLLESSEIAAFRLNADLVVLSACNTAEGGGPFGGDALAGLAESFFYAGARGVIASHWQVPSQATVALMTGMFARVQAKGTAEALRQSQLALIDQADTAHPFSWAAFTLIGDGLTATARTAEK
jgi:CHAT domain-containing protein/tetratricopeptide (TPR) repeat protein